MRVKIYDVWNNNKCVGYVVANEKNQVSTKTYKRAINKTIGKVRTENGDVEIVNEYNETIGCF